VSLEDQLTHSEIRTLRREVHEFLQLMDGLLDSIVDEMMDAVRFQSGALEVTIDTVPMRAVAEVIRQLALLPGSQPTVPLVQLTHAQL